MIFYGLQYFLKIKNSILLYIIDMFFLNNIVIKV
jgi:hypothetical protein